MLLKDVFREIHFKWLCISFCFLLGFDKKPRSKDIEKVGINV